MLLPLTAPSTVHPISMSWRVSMQRDYEEWGSKENFKEKKKKKPNLQVLWGISEFCWTVVGVRITGYLKLEDDPACKDHLLLTGWSGTKPHGWEHHPDAPWTWTGSNSCPGALIFKIFFFTYLNQNMTRNIFLGKLESWKVKKTFIETQQTHL